MHPFMHKKFVAVVRFAPLPIHTAVAEPWRAERVVVRRGPRFVKLRGRLTTMLSMAIAICSESDVMGADTR